MQIVIEKNARNTFTLYIKTKDSQYMNIYSIAYFIQVSKQELIKNLHMFNCHTDNGLGLIVFEKYQDGKQFKEEFIEPRLVALRLQNKLKV
jgi:hypothetical protein